MIILSAAVVHNAVIVRSEGLYQYFGASGSRRAAGCASLVVAAVTLMSMAAAWPLWHYVLQPRGLSYLRILAFGFLIAVFVQLSELILKAAVPAAAEKMSSYLPLIAADCAILGLLCDVSGAGAGFGAAMATAAGASLGFALAVFLLCGVREKLEFSDVPESFKGIPAALIAAALVGLAFIGFTGVLEGLLVI